MPSILEPIAAGIVVSLINKYILPKLDIFRPCASPPDEKQTEEDCVSSVSSASTAGSIHHIHF